MCDILVDTRHCVKSYPRPITLYNHHLTMTCTQRVLFAKSFRSIKERYRECGQGNKINFQFQEKRKNNEWGSKQIAWKVISNSPSVQVAGAIYGDISQKKSKIRFWILHDFDFLSNNVLFNLLGIVSGLGRRLHVQSQQ